MVNGQFRTVALLGIAALLAAGVLQMISAAVIGAKHGSAFAQYSDETTSDTSDLVGRLTFDFVNWIRHETEAIVDITLPKVEFRRSASGTSGWRHPDGDLVRLQGCGNYVNRLVVDWTDGRSDVVSPCSSEIKTVSTGKPKFEFSRLSPDKKRIAAELKYYVSRNWHYSVVVLEAGEIIAAFDGHASPTWLPDGRLVLTGNGLYVTAVDGKPERIDDGWLGVGVNNPDVSPDGEILVFEWNERLWVMDVEGREHKELVSGPMQYRFPVWSPDGHYVAFLAVAGNSHSEVDRAVHLIDVRKGEIERIDLSAYGGTLNHVPFGPLSWTP